MVQPWPGNVRQLQNTVRRAVVYAGGPLITPGDLGLEGEAGPGGIQWPAHLLGRDFGEARAEVVADFERAYVGAALAAADGNVAEAARASGLPRKSLWRIAQRVGLAADRAARREGRLDSGADKPPTADSDADATMDTFLAAERAGYSKRGLEAAADLKSLLIAAPGLDEWGALRAGAHRLKGSGDSYGFPEVSAAAAELEAAAARLDASECTKLLKSIEAALRA
ncbi:MAG: hypothetical protein GY898_32560 [Proteobacteria bacterium]|nr:hypothetical protein [Pseudomonadota bacterium]